MPQSNAPGLSLDSDPVRRYGLRLIRVLNAFPLWIDLEGGGISGGLSRDPEGAWEARTTRILMALLKPGMTVVDVGANIGYYTILFSIAANPGGRIIALEPEDRNYDVLCHNLAWNALAGKIELHKAALADRDGEIEFVVKPKDAGMHSLLQRPEGKDWPRHRVPAVTLDSIAGGRVDLVKMDIEGGEFWALRGMSRTLAANPDLILNFEYHEPLLREAGLDPSELFIPLQRAGMEWIRVENHPFPHFFAARPHRISEIQSLLRMFPE